MAGTIAYRSLVSKRADGDWSAAINAQKDVAWLPYSSGTTGKPKGVMLTHYNLIVNILQAMSVLNHCKFLLQNLEML